MSIFACVFFKHCEEKLQLTLGFSKSDYFEFLLDNYHRAFVKGRCHLHSGSPCEYEVPISTCFKVAVVEMGTDVRISFMPLSGYLGNQTHCGRRALGL